LTAPVERLLKLGARVLVSVRRVVVHLRPRRSLSCPPSDKWLWHWKPRLDNMSSRRTET